MYCAVTEVSVISVLVQAQGLRLGQNVEKISGTFKILFKCAGCHSFKCANCRGKSGRLQ